MVSTKLPHLKKINSKNPKIAKSQNRTISKGKHVPHYMQLRHQDKENKHLSKQKIKDIQEKKPKIIRTPRKKWIPVKIEPKGAALNARFYKGKPKPSIEVNRSEQDSSMARLRKFKHSAHGEDFDRSDSHCRRCEACRNRRDAFASRLHSKIKEASSTQNEDELAEEEKDSFHSQNEESAGIFSDLNNKLGKAFGKCIDESHTAINR